ncbi:hypothetical protein ACOSQ3_020942 [Xanthoceras sorbifolium]
MEKRGVQSLLMVFMILGLLVGQSAASLQTCYPICLVPCMIIEKNLLKCAGMCLKKCIFKPSSMDSQKENHYFCKLGCATTVCTNISTKEDPGNSHTHSIYLFSLLISAASLQTCYPICMVPYMIIEKNLLKCTSKCLKKCIFKPSSMDSQKENHYFCNLEINSCMCTSATKCRC